ncbi:MAG: oligosaccharide flippase family protein [Firmicutes bacterium]|nr:oligosaccharide flippase family protein [Bacillota bacterium]
MKVANLFKRKKDRTSSGSSAAKAGLWYTVGNMMIKGITFLSIPIFSRIMSQEDYGLYNTFLSYASILTIFLGLALNTSIKNAKYDFPEKLNSYCSSLSLLILCNTVLVAVLSAVFSAQLGAFAALGGGMAVLMVADSFGNAMLTFYNASLAVDFRYKEYLGLSFFYSINSILLSVLLILGVFPENGYLARTLGSVVPLLLISGYVLVRLFHSAKPRFSGEYWKYGLKFSLPLIPHGLSQILLSQFDRIMILNTISETKAGIYSFAYNIAILYQVLSTSMDTAWTPWFYERMAAGDEAGIRKKTSWYVLLMSGVAVLLMLVCPEVILLMGGAKYAESKYSVIPIVLGMYFAFLYYLPAAVEYYYKKTKLIAVGTVCAAVINIVLNAVFIPLYGYLAAAYTTVACYILYFFFHLFIARRLLGRFLFNMKNLLCSALAVCVFSAVCLLLVDHPVIRLAVLGALVLAAAAAAFRNKEMLKPLLKKILGKRDS